MERGGKGRREGKGEGKGREMRRGRREDGKEEEDGERRGSEKGKEGEKRRGEYETGGKKIGIACTASTTCITQISSTPLVIQHIHDTWHTQTSVYIPE